MQVYLTKSTSHTLDHLFVSHMSTAQTIHMHTESRDCQLVLHWASRCRWASSWNHTLIGGSFDLRIQRHVFGLKHLVFTINTQIIRCYFYLVVTAITAWRLIRNVLAYVMHSFRDFLLHRDLITFGGCLSKGFQALTQRQPEDADSYMGLDQLTFVIFILVASICCLTGLAGTVFQPSESPCMEPRPAIHTSFTSTPSLATSCLQCIQTHLSLMWTCTFVATCFTYTCPPHQPLL